MPLDNPNKVAHVSAVLQRTWSGRQKTVVVVYNNAGTYSYVAQSVIFRPQEVIDPQVPNLSGNPPGVPADLFLIAALTVSFTGLVYVADTSTATANAVANAAKYEVIEVVPTGIIPGGTHYRAALRRLR
jgi:hypothetical protein